MRRKTKNILVVLLIIIVGVLPILLLFLTKDLSCRKMVDNDYYENDHLQYEIEVYNHKGGELCIEGWVSIFGDNQVLDLDNKKIWIKNVNSNTFYEMYSWTVYRPDVTELIGNEDLKNYDYSGIKSEININQHRENFHGLNEVWICYRSQGANNIANTGKIFYVD